MCRLQAYSATNSQCCGHILIDLLIAPWFGGVPANYGDFATRDCVKSVGMIVHGNEFEPNITFLLKHVRCSHHTPHTHTHMVEWVQFIPKKNPILWKDDWPVI